MKLLTAIIVICSLFSFNESFANVDYRQRFETYQNLSTNINENHEENIRAFIKDDKPLSRKIRSKWLYYLARHEKWSQFLTDYIESDDIELSCYQAQALLATSQFDKASALGKSLWLNGSSMPKACDAFFKWFQTSPSFTEELITERIKLALDKRNLQLARYLLKQYKNPRKNDASTLFNLYQNPGLITRMQTGDLHDDFYLYGLKRLVSKNMDEAIRYFNHVNSKKLLDKDQSQKFLAHVALYKAMRQHDDAEAWFQKVKPAYYNDVLIDWQLRHALHQKNWNRVIRLIHLRTDKDAPDCQYWLARAYEAKGQHAKAKTIYESIAGMRQYYGFLASQRLNKPLTFEEEKPSTSKSLDDYQPILNNIEQLYLKGQTTEASRMLNDFISEMPKDEQSWLAAWVANHLNWYGKSVYLSNNDTLHNMLSLRFPLAYNQIIQEQSRQNKIKAEYIYAIIRQESAFKDDVVSFAGARGLMQLMPETAKQVARKSRQPLGDLSDLFKPAKNIVLGVNYLNTLGQRFNQHPALMAAAYNAGPNQVKNWIKRHKPIDIDIWIETIPWHETRNYLKNVLSFYAVYQYRMKQTPDISQFLKPHLES